MNIAEELRKRRIQGMAAPLKRGDQPQVTFDNVNTEWRGLNIFFGVGLIALVVIGIVLAWLKTDNASGDAWVLSFIIATIAAVIYYMAPIFSVIGLTIRSRKRPSKQSLEKFSDGQKFVCVALIAFGIFYVLNHLSPIIAYTIKHHHWPRNAWDHTPPYVSIWWHMVIIWLGMMLFLAYLIPALLSDKKAPGKRRLKRPTEDDLEQSATYPFGLWFGRSTGLLSRLWHRSGIHPNLDIVMSDEDAAQNISVFGGIGSGKTTRIMQPLLVQLLEQECGGLLFDVKGDVKKVVSQISKITNNRVTTIGPNHSQINLLSGLTPEVAASFLKSAFLLSGGVKLDGFWIDTATELCRNTLGLLSFLPPHYTLQGLYSYLFDEEVRDAIQAELNPLLVTLTANKQRLLKTYLRYHETIFSTFDEKIKSGVNATVAQALAPFNHPELIDAFCEQEDLSLNMQSVLDGDIYLVDMPLSRWGLGGKVAYTFIKLRFFNVMQSRNQHEDWNQERPVFFMCDEYQELISANKDGLSDLNFWDKSRSSKTIGIISAQSVSSFYAALGNKELTHAILQNFRQKICFRTEDQATLDMLNSLAGQALIKRKSISQTTDPNIRHDMYTKLPTKTENIAETRESVIDPVLLRNLKQNQAIAIFSLSGQSMDDVLECLPVFL